MPIVTLRPNATAQNPTAWTPVGGATHHAVTADDSDSTYSESWNLLRVGNEIDAERFIVALEDLASYPTGSRISAVRLRGRNRRDGSALTTFRFHVDRGTSALLTHSTTRTVDSWFTSEGPWWAERPGGGAWTLTNINAARIRVGAFTNAETSTRGRVSRLYLDVDYSRPPEASAVAPSGVVDDTTRPTVSWAYTSPDGHAQTGYLVEVYRTSDNALIYTSGVVSSASTSHQIDDDLVDGESYRVEVSVRQAWSGSGGDFWSIAPATATFTVDLPVPDLPILTVVEVDTATARIGLTIEPGPDATAATPETYSIQHSDNGGTTWRHLRGAVSLDAAGGALLELDDHEAPFGVERLYRARASIVVDGKPIGTAWTAPTSATLAMPHGSYWITDPIDPSRINGPVGMTEDRERTFHGRDVAHTPADLPFAVVESETPWRSDAVTIIAPDPAAHDALVEIFTTVRTLLYRDDRREHLYFRWVGDRTRAQIGRRIFDADTFAGTMVEVDRPTP